MHPITLTHTDGTPSMWRARTTAEATTPRAITAGKRYPVPCDLALFEHMFGAVNTGQPRRRRM